MDLGLRMRDKYLRWPDFLKAELIPRSVSLSPMFSGDGVALTCAFITITTTTEPLAQRATVARRSVWCGCAPRPPFDRDKLGVRWNKFFMLSRKTSICVSAPTPYSAHHRLIRAQIR